MRKVSPQVVRRFADLALARQKYEDVAPRCALPQLIDRIRDRFIQAEIARFLERPPALLDREHAT